MLPPAHWSAAAEKAAVLQVAAEAAQEAAALQAAAATAEEAGALQAPAREDGCGGVCGLRWRVPIEVADRGWRCRRWAVAANVRERTSAPEDGVAVVAATLSCRAGTTWRVGK